MTFERVFEGMYLLKNVPITAWFFFQKLLSLMIRDNLRRLIIPWMIFL